MRPSPSWLARGLAALMMHAVLLNTLAQAQFGGLKDLDPTNKNSALRRAGRDLDRGVRQAGRSIEKNAGRELRNGRDAVVGSLQSSWGEVGRAALPAAAHVMATRHARRPLETLPRRDREALRAHFGGLVDRARVVWGADPLDRWGTQQPFVLNLGNTVGQTYGNTIYIRYGKGDLSDYSRLKLLFHELVHVQQYARHGGLSGFGYHYFRGYAQAGFSYSGNPLEREAHQAEDGPAFQRVWQAYQQQSQQTLRPPTAPPPGSRTTLYNKTNSPIYFQASQNGGGFVEYRLEPGHHRWFDGRSLEVQFDASYAPGRQARGYRLLIGSQNDFLQRGDGIDLLRR